MRAHTAQEPVFRLRDILTSREILEVFVDHIHTTSIPHKIMQKILRREFPTPEETAFRFLNRRKRRSPGEGPTNRIPRSRIVRQRTPAWADLQAIFDIYERCQQKNQSGPTKWHVDHIVPLQGRFISGLHVENNLQIIPARDNVKKGNRF